MSKVRCDNCNQRIESHFGLVGCCSCDFDEFVKRARLEAWRRAAKAVCRQCADDWPLAHISIGRVKGWHHVTPKKGAMIPCLSTEIHDLIAKEIDLVETEP